MASLIHICSGRCYKCSEKAKGPDWKAQGVPPVTSTFRLVRALFKSKRVGFSDILDCWECKECGELVPADSWHAYQETGNIIVKHQKGK